MKQLILLALVLTTFQAQAETYNCYFGNPFGEVTYDSNSKILKTLENSTARSQGAIVKSGKGSAMLNVRVQELANGDLGLVSQQGQTLVTMKRTNSGSDGFTNFIYPFSATAAIDADNQGDGACETNSLRAEKPEMSLNDDSI